MDPHPNTADRIDARHTAEVQRYGVEVESCLGLQPMSDQQDRYLH